MKLKFSSKPFDIQSDKVVLYPKSELTFIANLALKFAIIVLVLVVTITKDVHMLVAFFFPLFTGAVILYIYGAQELVFDIKKKKYIAKRLLMINTSEVFVMYHISK